MTPQLDNATLLRLAAERAACGDGSTLSTSQARQLAQVWRPVAQPTNKEEEGVDLVDLSGHLTGAVAPRWLCHLLGLCHRTVHLALLAPQGWLVLQVRSRHVDWPGRLDLSVTGHVRAGLDWEEAVRAEAMEELGLNPDPAAGLVAAPGPLVVDTYRRQEQDNDNPPVHICHVTRLFAARLTAAGLAGLRFADGEVSALHLCSAAEAARLVAEEPQRVAPGLAQSLPRFLHWKSSVSHA